MLEVIFSWINSWVTLKRSNTASVFIWYSWSWSNGWAGEFPLGKFGHRSHFRFFRGSVQKPGGKEERRGKFILFELLVGLFSVKVQPSRTIHYIIGNDLPSEKGCWVCLKYISKWKQFPLLIIPQACQKINYLISSFTNMVISWLLFGSNHSYFL